MSTAQDPVVEADLDAYIDDQLPAARRIDVEAYLAGRPDAAARVMADLRTRDELRLALAAPAPGARPATVEAARRLERGLRRSRWLANLQRAASVAVLIGAGWLAAHLTPLTVTQVAASTPPPAFVEDAMRAHATTALRAGMASQRAAARYDPDDIRAATAIVMPALPAGWAVRDVQVYPSRYGPSVEVAVHAPQMGRVSLFAVRPGAFDVVAPALARSGEITSAYFQIGDVAYAVVAVGDEARLKAAAEALAKSLY